MRSSLSISSRHAAFWSGFFAIFLFLIWSLGSVLLPFVTGIAIAYFLNPACEWFVRRGVPRTMSTVIVLGFFVVLVVAFFLIVGPVVTSQTIHFAQQIPAWLDHLRNVVEPRIHDILNGMSEEDYLKLREAVTQHAGEAAAAVASFAGGVLRGGAAVVEALSLLVVTPIVAFYMLRDWPKLVAKVESWLPRAKAGVIRAQVLEVDRILAGFLRGQASVCLILGGFYGLGLTALGLNFGLLIGFSAGILSFMPYVGSLLGLLCGVVVAFLQSGGDWTFIGMVAGVFITGNLVEGNFITPKLVGESVGLHPVWIIFALMAGGSLLGFLGLLLAVPVAAVLGVFIRFALGRYLESSYYRSGARRRQVRPL